MGGAICYSQQSGETGLQCVPLAAYLDGHVFACAEVSLLQHLLIECNQARPAVLTHLFHDNLQVAVVAVEGLGHLPKNCLSLCAGFFFAAILMAVARSEIPLCTVQAAYPMVPGCLCMHTCRECVRAIMHVYIYIYLIRTGIKS